MWQITLLGYTQPDEFPWEVTLMRDHYQVAMEVVGVSVWPDKPHHTYSLSAEQADRLTAIMGLTAPTGVVDWELRSQRLYSR